MTENTYFARHVHSILEKIHFGGDLLLQAGYFLVLTLDHGDVIVNGLVLPIAIGLLITELQRQVVDDRDVLNDLEIVVLDLQLKVFDGRNLTVRFLDRFLESDFQVLIDNALLFECGDLL